MSATEKVGQVLATYVQHNNLRTDEDILQHISKASVLGENAWDYIYDQLSGPQNLSMFPDL